MDNRPGVSAVRSLPVCLSDWLMLHLHTVLLSLCQLLKLNDDDDANCIEEQEQWCIERQIVSSYVYTNQRNHNCR